MQREKLIELINLYFDNRLSKAEEVFLFTQLAEDDETRELFKDYNLLHTTIQNSAEPFPDELDQRILDNVLANSNTTEFKKHTKTPPVYSRIALYVFTVILMALSILLYNNIQTTQKKLEATIQQVNQQNRMIELLLNGLPETKVIDKIDNQIIIRANL